MNKISTTLLSLLGTVATSLGFLGIFLPLLPTTPFLLLAAYCFARSDPRRYRKLLDNPWFGRYIRDYRVGRIRRRERWVTLLVMWLVIGAAAVYGFDTWWARGLLLLIPACVTVHLLRLETYEPGDGGAVEPVPTPGDES